MHALRYKQQRQVWNALRRTLSNPGQFLAFLMVAGYGAISVLMIAALLVLPLPADMNELLELVELETGLAERLQNLRGALTLTLLLFSSIAAFQNPLLRFANADIDIGFTTPIPLWHILLGRLFLNHLRAFFAAYFFWGLTLVVLLRLGGFEPWPSGLWGMFGLMMLFASVDQGFAALQLTLIRRDIESDTLAPNDSAGSAPRSPLVLWLVRVAVLLLVGLLALLVLGVLVRLLSGSWFVLGLLFNLAGGPVISLLLFPLRLVSDLLLVPVQVVTPVPLAFGTLVLLDVLTGLLLLRQVNRGGAGVLLETALAPTGRPSRLDELLVAVNFNPLRLLHVVWHGAWDTLDDTRQQHATVRGAGAGASAHQWRRAIELRRTPLRNLMAILLMGLIPLGLYQPTEPYSLLRLVTAIIFSTSLGTQLFNDAADHIRYANLELSAPVARWQLLWHIQLPRLLVYWAGGLLLLLGVGLLSDGARWFDLLALALWYPLILMSMLAMRSMLVFVYPAAGLPGQRDPVQGMLVTLANGMLLIAVVTVSILPFSLLTVVTEALQLNPVLFLWPIVFVSSALICAFACGLMLLAYMRFEPQE